MARRNDGPWRREVLAKRGEWCRSCKRNGKVQCDHLRPRSQGGKSVVENGLPLCEECHRAKTEHRLLIRREWLDPDQLVWLEDTGWCWWGDDGDTWGEGRKSFAPVTTTTGGARSEDR